MIKCPFCHFDNEDGALFCEQCKSDLAGAAPVAMATPVMAQAEAMVAEAVPIEAVPVEAVPVEAVPLEAMPMAAAEAVAMPIEAAPAMEIEPPPPPAPPAPPEPPPAPAAAAPPPAAPAEPAPAPPPAAPAAAAPAPAAAAPAAAVSLPAGAQPRLLVQRGLKRNAEYPIYEGLNFIGRADEKPVDIDLEDQEPPDRIWCSRQHACISFEADQLFIEDLNSANGTYVNRNRIYPGQKRPLAPNDVVQIGNVQLRVVV
jgi:pSer/pThr/pTyr-binding forkhead associated (FHA) protein